MGGPTSTTVAPERSSGAGTEQAATGRVGSDGAARLAAVHRAMLDGRTDSGIDDVVAFAAQATGSPMAALSLVDAEHQWFASAVGLPSIGIPRQHGFCHLVVESDAPVVVDDALADRRFASSPLVQGAPSLRSYAGVPVHAFGETIGSLCVFDDRPRQPSERDLATLQFLARQIEHLIDLHRRRAAAIPPSRHVAIDLAHRLTAGESFESVCLDIDRPAWIYDVASLAILAVNDRAVGHYGWSREEFTRRSILDVRPPSERRLLAAALDNSDIDRYSSTRLWQHRRADDQVIDVRISAANAVHAGRNVRLVLVTDVTEHVALGDAIDRAGRLDSLTGLPNRRELIRTLRDQLAVSPERTAVLFVDLDRFKLVNDALGHDAGDALLGAAAARIRQCTPTSDLVARIGGDEFAVVRAIDEPEAALLAAEEIRLILDQPFVLDEGEHYVSASIGITLATASSSAQSLLAESDAAMYAAKQAGRNGVALFDDVLRAEMREWVDVQRDLHHAIEHREIDLDVQPIVHLTTGAVTYEALARWNHPLRGRLGPGTFIPVAEDSGLIRQLGDQILEMGAAHAAALDTQVSVNVSVRQFNRALVRRVAGLIDGHGLAPGQLVIEITESAVIDNDHAAEVLAGLRAAGADIWIDDFGTGYSSLARLASLTVDGLKLPIEFVNDLDSPHGWGIASAVVSIARALAIEVIAEGVETAHQLERVRELGCDAVQGYLLGRPRPFGQELARIAAARLSDDGEDT